MNRIRFWFFSVLITAVAVTMAACGSGDDGSGGGADMMAITISSPTATSTTTYTEGPINSYGYYDPYMETNIVASSGRTWITLSSGVISESIQPDIVINIWLIDHAEGPHDITGGCTTSLSTCVSYTDHGTLYDSFDTSGTVTIESIGDVGQPVIGFFSAAVDSGTETLTISGTFNVKREN